ncbi:hypothetical protein LSH36_897g00000, partial [Paralvinella palmiformis]
SDSKDDTDPEESKLQLLIVLDKQIMPSRKALRPAVTIVDAAEMVLTTNGHPQPRLVFSQHQDG